MAGNKFLTLVNGLKTLVSANQTSAGAPDAGKLVALNSAGQLDNTMMPSGLGVTAAIALASAAISAGMLVNLYSYAGVLTARPADNTSAGQEANAFATAAVSSGASGTFNLQSGLITGLSGLTLGSQYFLGTVGAPTLTPPSTTGYIIQPVGKAISTSSIEFQPDYAVTIA